MADSTVLQASLSDNSTDFEYEAKQWLYLPDSQNGSYSTGQVSFDLSPWASSDQYVNLAEAVITIPLVLSLAGSVSGVPTAGKLTADKANAYAMNLKNYLHLIHSMSVQINGVTYQNLCTFQNMDANYKVLASFSTSDAVNLGPSIGFAKDDGVFSYGIGGTNNGGLGECNNFITQKLNVPTLGYHGFTALTSNNYNSGRMARLNMSSFDINSGITNYEKLVKSTTEMNNELRNYCVQSSSADEVVYYILATIPVKFVSNLMANLPLMKGAKVTLQIQTNTFCQQICSVTAGGTGGFNKTVNSVSSNGCIPFQISPAGYAASGSNVTGFNPITTVDTAFIASLGIARGYKTILTTWAHPQTNCRFYAPMYKLSPMAEELILTKAPVKHIVYNDLYSSIYANLGADSNITYTLPFNVAKPRYLLICPYLCSLNNGADNPASTTCTNGAIVGSPINSMFSSAPNTVTPFVSLTNFNVSLAGTAIYQQNVNYNWQQFQNEVRPSMSINGGQTIGMSSGLISESDWNSGGMNFVYVDLSRHSIASDAVSKQITITATNSSLVPIDLYCFVAYEKQFSLNVSNGQVVQE